MKILFLTPSASRGGSEMMLHYLFSSFNKETFDSVLYADAKGVLVDDFSKIIPTYYSGNDRSAYYKVKNKIHRTIFNKSLNEDLLLKIHQKFKPDFWYFNTIALTEYADVVLEAKIPYVIHFHELISVYDDALGQNFKKLVENADMLIGCSDAVCDQIKVFNHSNVVKFNSFVKLDHVKADDEKRKVIRNELGIKPTDFVWLMSGATSYRKGFDLIPQIMEHLDDQNTHMVWLGRDRNTGYVYATKERAKRDFPSRIHFIDEKSDDYYEYLNISDGFLLTAREDPFPLVMIESAYMGKPIAAYNSGGVKEFVMEGMGIVTENFSHSEIAAGMKKIMNNEILIDNNTLKARAKEFDASNQISRWEKIMTDYFKARHS